MNNDELKQIREQLPHGAQKTIAERAKVNTTIVNLVLHGKAENPKVLEETAKFLKTYNSRKKRAIASLQQAAML